MYAKQYEITLPADYDMGILRKRVEAASPILDDRDGLGFKAYVIRERGSESPVNEYAPFYLWNDVRRAAEFLVGGAGFERIIRSFGRATVLHWTGLAAFAGPARDVAPTVATRRLTRLPADPDLDDTGLGLSRRIEQEIAEVEKLARIEGVHTAALVVDPRHWELVRFVVSAEEAADDEATERYQVLHVSAPHLADLPEGRVWK